MKYYLLVGEASGDLHASNLMKALQKEDSNAEFRFWGGDLMQAVGGELVVHYKERAFMGFAEVLMNLRKIFGFMSFCKKDIAQYKPDLIIFVDNSGFNLRIAKWAKKEGFRTNYYISPQVWASRASRVKAIKRDIDQLYLILPFEEAFYQKYDYKKATFVGHPLLDAIADRKRVSEKEFRATHKLNDKPIIALLPGSRKQEITKMLSVMLKMVPKFKDYQFVIAGAPSQDYEFYKQFIKDSDIQFIDNKTYDLLSFSYAALVTSGTATLETALFKVPQVVCYKAGNISYQIAKRIITLKFISLVNLIMDREVVTELIQHDFNEKRLEKELTKILEPQHREKLFEDYYELEQKLGGKGASAKAARLIVNSNLSISNKLFINWVNEINKNEKPNSDIVAYHFGLIETTDGFSIYLIGSKSFDENDEDWACNVDFNPKNKYLNLPYKETKGKDWRDILKLSKKLIKNYISSAEYNTSFLKNSKAITTGFDGGNLERIK